MSGCESSLNGWNGPGISGTDSDLLTIINCKSHDNKGIGYTFAEGMTNSVIDNCESQNNFYAAYTISAYQSSVNNGGGINNVVIKDSTSYGDGYGYKFVVAGIWTDGVMAATDVVFQNMKAVVTASGIASRHFGVGKEYDGLWLAGKFTATVKNSIYTFPDVTYAAYVCDSTFPTLHK